jgi:hypothetical protein
MVFQQARTVLMPTADRAPPTARRKVKAFFIQTFSTPRCLSHPTFHLTPLPGPHPPQHCLPSRSHSPIYFAPGTQSNHINYDFVESARCPLRHKLTDSHTSPSSGSTVASEGDSDTSAAVPRAKFERRDGPPVPGSGRHRYLGSDGKSERAPKQSNQGNAGSSWMLFSAISVAADVSLAIRQSVRPRQG